MFFSACDKGLLPRVLGGLCLVVMLVGTCAVGWSHRDRDLPPVGRVRKRPSMLSEFHGKHYNYRDTERDR